MKSGYNTKQKNEILKYFENHPNESVSARELIESPDITSGEATVYRTLLRLAEEGVIKKITDTATGTATYRADGGENCRSHIHLLCKNCGKAIHLNCKLTHIIETGIQNELNFTVDCESTVIYGLCASCRGEL